MSTSFCLRPAGIERPSGVNASGLHVGNRGGDKYVADMEALFINLPERFTRRGQDVRGEDRAGQDMIA